MRKKKSVVYLKTIFTNDNSFVVSFIEKTAESTSCRKGDAVGGNNENE